MTRPSDAAPALRQIQRQLRQINGEMTRLLSSLEEETPTDPDYENLGRIEAILKTLKAQAIPMTPVQIWSALQASGFTDQKNLIQVTTYQLWRRGRVAKLGRGLYCHPDHLPPDAQPERPVVRASARRRSR